MADSVTFKPRFGIVLTIAVGVVAVTVWVSALGSGVEAALRAIAPLTLLLALTWAAYWRPAVIISDDEVEIRNVFSTDRVRYEQIQRIDTRYALTLETTQGKITAWAAPAPGRHASVWAGRDDGARLPESSYLAGTVRPGDLTSSDSGAVAVLIRRRWETLRDLHGSIGDGPAVERDRSVHIATIITLVVLAAASAVSILL